MTLSARAMASISLLFGTPPERIEKVRIRMRKEHREGPPHGRYPLVVKILILIGALTVLYLFVTEILMRILASLTIG